MPTIRKSYWPLPLTMAATLALLAGVPEPVAWLARIGLIAYLIAEWPRQSRLAKVLIAAAATLAAAEVLWTGRTELLLPALDRAAFYATFVACLGMLRVAAQDSPLVRRCGKYLISQPPRRRYLTLSLGSVLFGLVLNIGVIGLLGVMSLKGNTLTAAGGHEIIQQVRRRRMLMAILRGFALAPLVSPLGISLAVILSTMPVLRYPDLVPYTLSTGLLLLLLGWLQDTVTAPRQLAPLVPEQPTADPRPLYRFVLLVTAVVAFTVASALITGARLPVAVLFTVPVSAFLWLAVQRRRLGGGSGIGRATTAVVRRAGRIFPPLRGEVAILGSAGFAGELLAAVLPRSWLAERIVDSGLHGPGLAAAGTAAVVLAAQLGLNPIISVTLLASLLPNPAVIGVPPALLATGLMAGWGLAMVSSPLTASMLITAELAGRSPYAVGYRWNGTYLAGALVMLLGWFLVLGNL